MSSLNHQPLPAGKLPAPLLDRLLAGLPREDPQLIVGPAVGEDAAVIDWSAGLDNLLVVKSDPITFATEEIGYYAVHVCANDLAVTGATPRFYLPTILLPADKSDAALAARIFAQIGAACRALGIVVAGGHSEITPTVNQPVVAGTMLGAVQRNLMIPTSGATPGDVVLLAGGTPVEGVSIIAREKRQTLLARGWDVADLDTAAAYLHKPGISVLVPASLATQTGVVTAMHDPTEGGIATGLSEVASAAGVGLTINLDAIPVPDLAHRLCAEFSLDPLGTIASGALLATVLAKDAEVVLDLWRAHGWPAAAIGHVVTADEGISAWRNGKPVALPEFAVDEITKLWPAV